MPLAGPGELLFPVLKNEIRSVRSALWFRPTAFCCGAVVAAVLLAMLDALLPPGSLTWLPEVQGSTADELLKLLAGSMLTVASVTLSVLMLVLSLTAGQVSPRAVPEIMADPVTQNALGTFLGTFVYALTGLLFIGFDLVSHSGVTLIVCGAVVLVLSAVRYLVQWIHHVAEILKINRIIHRIHHQAAAVLETYFGSESGDRDDLPGQAGRVPTHLHASDTGYIQLIDAKQLNDLACENDLVVRLCVQEGDFVHPQRRLMELYGQEPDMDLAAALRATAVIGFDRSHEGDPRFGFELLAEVACRALSPGINDPQSALACVEYLGSLLAMAGSRPGSAYPADCSADGRIAFVRPGFSAMLKRAFRPVMRDGAGSAEVIVAIMQVLKELAGKVAPDHLASLEAEAQRAEGYGTAELLLETDRDALVRTGGELRAIAARRRR